MLLNLEQVTQKWMTFRNDGDGPGPWQFDMLENSIIEATVLNSIARTVKDSGILLHGRPDDVQEIKRLLQDGYYQAQFADVEKVSPLEGHNYGRFWTRGGQIYIVPEYRNAVQVACQATSTRDGPELNRYVVVGLWRRREEYFESKDATIFTDYSPCRQELIASVGCDWGDLTVQFFNPDYRDLAMSAVLRAVEALNFVI